MNYSDVINETASRHYNVADEYKDNTVEENRAICDKQSLPFSIAVMSVAGDLNIGMMMRTASLLGASDFFIFGRRKYDKRSTVGAQNYINVHRYPMDVKSLHDVCQDTGYQPVFIEQGGLTLPLTEGEWNRMPTKPMFVFGSESDGIPEDIIYTFPYAPIISIPQRGVLRSYNVSSAMSIVTWEATRRLVTK
jgi:tRNA G18 (ribose-2'-O)-methylase SpoU